MRNAFCILLFGATLLATSRPAMAGPAGSPAQPGAIALLPVNVTGSQVGSTVQPGAQPLRVFIVQLSNSDPLFDATLTSISFENRISGSGSQTQRDQSWQPLVLTQDKRIILEPIEGTSSIEAIPIGEYLGTAIFSSGTARFSGLSVPISAGTTVTLYVFSGASLSARDADALDLRIPSSSSVTISGASVGGNFPIDPSGTFPIDGMVVDQIKLFPVTTPTLAVGSIRNLALDVRIPTNGYSTDVLQRLAVQNLGTARATDEIAGMEAWLDDGDDLFSPAADTRLGPMVFTGDRWQLSGLSVPIPLAGVRVFVSADVAELAEAGRTLRLALPTLPDVGVGVQSGNDGPVDGVVANPSAQTIAVVDRVALAVKPVDSGAVDPGQAGVTLLDLVATNTYSVDKQLTSLVVTNAASGPGSQAQLDGETTTLALRLDANDDGALDGGDPVVATSFFIGGRASFGGFAWDLPAGKSRQLFVTGDVALLAAADGDVLAGSVAGAADLGFSDPTALSAIFPLGPGAAWKVDGMIAAQIQNRGAPALTLGPSEGPALALDGVVRRNGYRDDLLTGFAVTNVGTAADSDFAEVHLWQDGGDGQLSGDDQDLGVMTAGPGGWTSGALSVPLTAAGARLFASVTAAATPTDSATVQLALPPGGLAVQSDNDGPRDLAVVNSDALLLTDRALLASLDVTPDAVTVGQLVTVRMTVRNISGEAVDNVTPSALTISGSATLAYASGPVPAAANIGALGQQVFTWTYTATGVGQARFTGSASGVGNPSGTPRSSLPATSDPVDVFQQADHLPWSASTAMPLSVNRGQTNVVPLFLTLGDGSGGGSSGVLVTALKLRIESGSGAGIIPADLLSRVAVQVGGTTHVSRTSLETSGSTVDLTLATPILVNGGSAVTAAIAIDIAPATVVPNFRLVIPDSTYLTGEDATTGAPVVLVLQGQSYPVRTTLARVVAEATELDVAAVPGPRIEAAQGQPDVRFATLRLTNPGVTGVTSDVRVASFAVVLRDASGITVTAPDAVIERVRVRVGPQLLADQPVTASSDSLIDLTLSPLLSVPVNAPIDLELTADLPSGATLGTWRLSLADSTLFDARDPNSGNRVAVVYAAAVIEGDSVTIETPADSVVVVGVPRMPSAIGVGAAGVVALDALLRHPGAPGTAAVRLDSLVVRCVDEGRNPIPAGAYVERLHVRWNGVTVATLADPPVSGNVMALGLPGLAIEPGERDTLTLALDFEAAAPPGSFELILNASGMIATDADTRQPVTVAGDGGFEFPILSGLTRLSAPARTLIADLVDHMPAGIAADGAEVVAGDVTLLNDAAIGSGTITVDHFGLRAADAARAALAVGAGAQVVRLYSGGSMWAEAALQPADTVATLTGAPLVMAPQVVKTLELRFVPRAAAAVPGLRLGFGASDVGVVQSTNPLLAVAVQPPAGKSFPLWTEYGGFAVADLDRSYSNFPNPFAAGREPTRFAYYLPSDGRVTLRIWTARGERVVTVLEAVSRGQGLHQDDAWDGRNGRGDVVTNGVYVAEMVVQLDAGGSRRLLRKVAVVR